MVRDSRRSALLLIRKSRCKKVCFCKLIVGIPVFIVFLMIPKKLVESADDTNLISSANIMTSNLKFGDRLSPRNKQSVSISAFLNISSDSENVNNSLIKFDVNNIKDENNEKPISFNYNEIEKMSSGDGNIENPHNLKILNNIPISKADRFEMSTEFFVIPSQSNLHSTNDLLNGNRIITKSGLVTAPKLINLTLTTAIPPRASLYPSVVSLTISNGLRKESWVIPILVLALLTMIMMAAFEMFVLFKAWKTSPSRRHLFLGQTLLFGLFISSGFGALVTSTPTSLSCGAIRFGIGVSYAIVFSALLVKCVFLISLNSGVYLPAPYQGLLLLFAVLIQIAIGAQWLLTQPPEIYMLTIPTNSYNIFRQNSHSQTITGKFSMLITSNNLNRLQPVTEQHSITTASTTIPICKTHYTELLLSLIYIVFLIIFVGILAIKSRGIRDNYREATYIGLAVGGTVPIWLGWTFCGLAVADRHKDACIGFGLVATSATIFLVMFMPKGRQLAAMGKEGLYVEDREDRFSSLSRAGSGYSPSFFHFKPIKYGVINQAANCGNGAISKQQTSTNFLTNNNDNGPRDSITPVATAFPSYTRMYQYFPAHLTHPFCFYPQLPQTSSHKGISLMTSAHLAQTFKYPGEVHFCDRMTQMYIQHWNNRH